MKRILCILLIVALSISITTGVVLAKSTTQKIEYDLDEGTYESWGLIETEEVNVPASAVFSGNLKIKEENSDSSPQYFYLSPMSGTITINDVVHQMLVKPIKPSEIILYSERELGQPGEIGYWYEKELWCFVEVAIEGSRYTGMLYSRYYLKIDTLGEEVEGGESELRFAGIMDEKWVECVLTSDSWPEIN
ncbi:hypothetical protein ACFLVN_03975 [Chloroflexota bacterium]